jgi:hypothetical protein
MKKDVRKGAFFTFHASTFRRRQEHGKMRIGCLLATLYYTIFPPFFPLLEHMGGHL